MKRPNWQIVWNYLLQVEGSTIDLYPENGFNTEFGIVENKLCTKAQRIIFGKPVEIVWIPYDISLNDFISTCDRLSEHTILSCVFALGLHRHSKESP